MVEKSSWRNKLSKCCILARVNVHVIKVRFQGKAKSTGLSVVNLFYIFLCVVIVNDVCCSVPRDTPWLHCTASLSVASIKHTLRLLVLHTLTLCIHALMALQKAPIKSHQRAPMFQSMGGKTFPKQSFFRCPNRDLTVRLQLQIIIYDYSIDLFYKTNK